MTRLTRRHRSWLFIAIVGIGTLVASINSGNTVAGVEGIAILAVFFGGAEVARRRGSSAGAVISGEYDERTGRLYELAAARTAVAGYFAAVAWIIYGIAASRETDTVGLTLVAFAAVFYANVAWITFRPRLRSTGTAAQR